MNYIKQLPYVALGLLIGSALVYFLAPHKIKTETKIVYVEKEKENREVGERIVVIERPDGTRETITDTNIKETIDRERSKEESSVVEKSLEKQWDLAIIIQAPTRDLLEYEYGIHIQRRILGGIKAGIYANTNEEVGLSIGMSF